LADEHPTVFAGLLGRLIPIQAKVKTDDNIRARLEKLDMSMTLSEMIQSFEQKIKSDYMPVEPRLLIEQRGDDDDDDDA
jgi:hypothetical protein